MNGDPGVAPPLGGRLVSGAGFYLLRFVLSALSSLGINLYVMTAYPLQEVGYLAIVMIVAATVVQLADLGIGAWLIQSRTVPDDETATRLYSNVLAAWMPLLGGTLVSVACWPSPLLLLTTVLVLTIPITAMRLLASATAEQRFGFAAVAGLDMAETAALVVVVLLSAWLGIGIWGYVLGCAARAVVGWAVSSRLRTFRLSLTMPRWDAAWGGALRFGLWYHAGTMLTAFRALVLPLSLASLIGLTAVGIVDRSVFLAGAPALLLGAIQARVLFPFFSATRNEPERKRIAFEKALHLAACLDKLLFLPLLLLLEPSVHRFLAPAYGDMVPLVWILAVANAAFGALASTAMPVLNGQGRADIVAWLAAGGALLTWLVAWPLVGWLGVQGAVIANMSVWLGVIIICMVLRRLLPGVRILRRTGVPFLAFLVALAIGWAVMSAVGRSADMGASLVGTVAALLAYLALLVAFDREGTLDLASALHPLLRRRGQPGENTGKMS